MRRHALLKRFMLWMILFSFGIICQLHGQVMINEVMSKNLNAQMDENGDRHDWIEMYNPDSVAVSLHKWGLSNDPAMPYK
jgi:hypothetical protein